MTQMEIWNRLMWLEELDGRESHKDAKATARAAVDADNPASAASASIVPPPGDATSVRVVEAPPMSVEIRRKQQ